MQADFNADGLKDLFIGGGRGQEPVLYLQTKIGKYRLKNTTIFKQDSMYEDADAIAFDIDADGDLDIGSHGGLGIGCQERIPGWFPILWWP